MDAAHTPQTGNGVQQEWPGGDGVMLCEAATGATVGLQILGPGGVWINVVVFGTATAIALAAQGMANFSAPNGPMRVAAGAATGVIASVVGIPTNNAG